MLLASTSSGAVQRSEFTVLLAVSDCGFCAEVNWNASIFVVEHGNEFKAIREKSLKGE